MPAFGATLPGPVWKAVLADMTRDLPVKPFDAVDPSVVRGFRVPVPSVSTSSSRTLAPQYPSEK